MVDVNCCGYRLFYLSTFSFICFVERSYELRDRLTVRTTDWHDLVALWMNADIENRVAQLLSVI